MHTCMGDKSKKTCEHGSLSHHHPSLPRSCIGMVQECRLVHCEVEKGRGKTRKNQALTILHCPPKPCALYNSVLSLWFVKFEVVCDLLLHGLWQTNKGIKPRPYIFLHEAVSPLQYWYGFRIRKELKSTAQA